MSVPNPQAPVPILIIEDDRDAIVLIRRLLTKAGIDGPISSVRDGEAAITLLQSLAAGTAGVGVDRPRLMFLDLHMPRVNGFGVLKWIQESNAFPDCAVVVMSTSDLASDIEKAYRLGACAYLTKYPEVQHLARIYEEAAQHAEGFLARVHALPFVQRRPMDSWITPEMAPGDASGNPR